MRYYYFCRHQKKKHGCTGSAQQPRSPKKLLIPKYPSIKVYFLNGCIFIYVAVRQNHSNGPYLKYFNHNALTIIWAI